MTPLRSALVTGATGFIGQHLVRRLVAENVTTYCLVRADSLTTDSKHRLAGAHCLTLQSDAPADWQRALEGISTEVVLHLASPGVVGCHQIRTRGSEDHAFLDLHVWYPPHMPLHEAHRLSHLVKDRLMAAFPQIADAIIHIEPPPP